jgi:hypothetical protein
MKLIVVLGVGTIALLAALVGSRSFWLAPAEIQCEASHREAATQWTPSDAELANGNQGVGWVFGRMIGVADAPGSPNHAPFGSASAKRSH